jgi:hypothetical protein
MSLRLGIAIVAAVSLLSTGCRSRSAARDKEEKQAKAAEKKEPSLRKFIDRQRVPEQMHNLGLFYTQFAYTYGRGPETAEEFRSYIGGEDGKLASAIKSKYYTLVCKVNNPSANTIIAFEREPDDKGERWILTGDASVHKMNETQFRKVMRAQ